MVYLSIFHSSPGLKFVNTCQMLLICRIFSGVADITCFFAPRNLIAFLC